MRIVPFVSLLILGGGCVAAQPADASPRFEVAAIKPGSAPQPVRGGAARAPGLFGCTGGPGTPDPGRFACNDRLSSLLFSAYQLQSYQFTAPDWMQNTWFEIDAKIPAGTTKEQFLLMQQNLFAERFKLAVHWDKKEMQIYEMTVGPGGQKFKEWTLPPVESPEMAFPSSPKDHIKAADFRAPSNFQYTDGTHAVRAKESMKTLAAFLTVYLERPVIDATGLTREDYDIMLDYVMETQFAPGRGPADPPPLAAGPTLLKAVESQLGLKLESKKGMIDVLIIDHMEKTPTEN